MNVKQIQQKRKFARHEGGDSDEDENERPKKKLRLDTEIVNKQPENNISIDLYKTQRVIDDMHDDIAKLLKRQRKDKKIINELYLSSATPNESIPQTTDNSTNQITKTSFDVMGFLGRTLGTFIVPVLLFTIDQITKASTKPANSPTGSSSPIGLPSASITTNTHNDIFK